MKFCTNSDLDGNSFKMALRSAATLLRLQDYKILFCVIMTHGSDNGGLHCHDGAVFSVEEVLEEFAALKGLIKVNQKAAFTHLRTGTTSSLSLQIFLFNACRGTEENRVQTDAGPDNIFSDCFLWFGCEDNHVSYRDAHTGSPFIKAVSKVGQYQPVKKVYKVFVFN